MKEKIYSFFAILLVVLSNSGNAQNAATLRLVQTVFRHGDRNPGSTFPTDPYGMDLYPEGPKQLTKLGIQQTYQYGQYLRQRYAGFLNSQWHMDEAYAQSSNEERALQSGLSVLAGLYPPVGVEVWSSNINWYPVPLHAWNDEDDPLLKVSGFSCPKYEKREKQLEKQYSELEQQKYSEFMRFIRNVSGLPSLKLQDINDVLFPLLYQKTRNLNLPSWADQATLDTMKRIQQLTRWMEFDDTIEGKLRGGFLLNDLLTRMQQKAQGKLKPKELRLQLYSAHDGTVLALMSALRVYNNEAVPFVGALILELHEMQPNDFKVALYYRNATDQTNPYLLNVPGCSQAICNLNEFAAAVQPRLVNSVDQLKQECDRTDLPCKKKNDSSDENSSSEEKNHD